MDTSRQIKQDEELGVSRRARRWAWRRVEAGGGPGGLRVCWEATVPARPLRVPSGSPPFSASGHVDSIVLSGRFLQGLNSPPGKRWGSTGGCQHPSQSFFLLSDGALQPRASSLTHPEVKAAWREALPTQRNITNLSTRGANPASRGAADSPGKPRSQRASPSRSTEKEDRPPERAPLMGASRDSVRNFSRNTADLEKEFRRRSALESDRRRLVKKT